MTRVWEGTVKDDFAIQLKVENFKEGSLSIESNVRPNRLFTADRYIILYKVGCLHQDKINQIVNAIVNIIRR